MRRSIAAGLLLLGCRPGPGPIPLLPDRYSQVLSERVGSARDPAECEVPPWDLGPATHARMRRLHLRVPLPVTWVQSSSFVPLERAYVPEVGTIDAEEWRPGLFLAQPGFYRWTRVGPTAGTVAGPDPAEAMLQIIPQRGYQLLSGAPDWTMSNATECTMPVAGRVARVISFSLQHRTLAPLFGVTAFWRGRPDDGWISALGLGPDAASRAELFAILRAIEP